jgi:Response regulator containing CheY-like receiver domain and AraC-type DNA-binding domain
MKEARADLYHRWGQFDKSSALYKEYIAKKDSMQRVEMAEKLHSLRTRYEVDRLEMQRVQQARSFRNTLRWFGFVTLCGIAVIALITTLYRKKNAAYKVLAQRVSEWAHSGESRYSPAAPGKVSGQSQNEPLTEEEAKIMSFIETEMTSGHAYRDAALNMDSLADRLGVHRNTVSKAVNKSTGNNFSYYVNGYRIREAVRILSESDREKIYIEELAEHVGFTNHSSFYRAFKQFTALSPAEFRKNKSDGPKNQ